MLAVDSEATFACSNPNHSKNISMYPRERVPLRLFDKPDGSMYRTCYDCRKYDKQKRQDVRKRRRDAAEKAEEGALYNCVTCNGLRIKECCVKCEARNAVWAPDKTAAYDRVIVERIRETNVCCEVCKKSFVRHSDGSHGFIVVDTLEGVDFSTLELRNLEFDHLTETEQIARFGRFIGKKKTGVYVQGSYAKQKQEAAKCQLVCLYCHVLESARRRRRNPLNPGSVISIPTQEKLDFVEAEKLRLRGCAWCGHFDPNNLAYYEFDHIDARHKKKNIAIIVWSGAKSGNTLACLKDELSKCRLLCRFCHRKRSGEQRKQANVARRAEGLLKYQRVALGETENIVDKILRELDEMTTH